jgi:hypothetical protein
MVGRVESDSVRVQLGSGRVIFGGERLVGFGLDCSSLAGSAKGLSQSDQKTRYARLTWLSEMDGMGFEGYAGGEIVTGVVMLNLLVSILMTGSAFWTLLERERCRGRCCHSRRDQIEG